MSDTKSSLPIPDTDVLGCPTAPCEVRRSQWAVLIDASVRGVPGPHMLGSQDETEARGRLAWWQANRPDVSPRLVGRVVVEVFGEWEAA